MGPSPQHRIGDLVAQTQGRGLAVLAWTGTYDEEAREAVALRAGKQEAGPLAQTAVVVVTGTNLGGGHDERKRRGGAHAHHQVFDGLHVVLGPVHALARVAVE